MTKANPKLLLVISNSLVIEGLKSTFQQHGIQVLGTASTGEEGLEKFKELKPDVVILGLRLPDMCAADDLLAFIEVDKDTPLIIYAGRPGDAETTSTLRAGASGFLTSDLEPEEMVDAVKVVCNGSVYIPESLRKILGDAYVYEDLTNTESEVLRMMVGGLSNKEIAFAMDVSENTVKTHIKHLYEKLHVSDRTSASVVAIKRGLVRVDV